MSKVKDIVDYLLSEYPLSLCSDFDKGKTGLQFGDKEKEVKKVMITLDATSKVIDEAINNNCEMIISHHPFLFNSLLNMDYSSPFGKKMLNVFDHRLNLFSMHTNFDSGSFGMNDLLAGIIGLKNVTATTLEPTADSLIRIGEINPTTLKDFGLKIKNVLSEESIKVCGDLNSKIEKVGIIGGGGSFSWTYAKSLGCDVFISGEFRHNNGIDAEEVGFNLIEVSHYVESMFKPYIQQKLSNQFSDVEFIVSKVDHNPFKTL